MSPGFVSIAGLVLHSIKYTFFLFVTIKSKPKISNEFPRLLGSINFITDLKACTI